MTIENLKALTELVSDERLREAIVKAQDEPWETMPSHAVRQFLILTAFAVSPRDIREVADEAWVLAHDGKPVTDSMEEEFRRSEHRAQAECALGAFDAALSGSQAGIAYIVAAWAVMTKAERVRATDMLQMACENITRR